MRFYHAPREIDIVGSIVSHPLLQGALLKRHVKLGLTFPFCFAMGKHQALLKHHHFILKTKPFPPSEVRNKPSKAVYT